MPWKIVLAGFMEPGLQRVVVFFRSEKGEGWRVAEGVTCKRAHARACVRVCARACAWALGVGGGEGVVLGAYTVRISTSALFSKSWKTQVSG